jgi:hypothetical protein
MTDNLAMAFLDNNLAVSTSNLIITILSAFISTVFGVAAAWFTVKRARYNFYSSTVSKERVDWLVKTREITSELIAFCAMHEEDVLSSSDVFQFEKLRSALLLRLSPKSFVEEKRMYVETDGRLIAILEGDYISVRNSKNEIREIVTLICKNEWGRIKAEAGGNKHIEKKIEKYDASIAKMFENNKKKGN